MYRAAVSDLDDAEASASLAGYDELVDSAHKKRTYSVALIGSGLAVAGAGMVRYILIGRRNETHDVAVIPIDDGGMITWGGRF